VPPASTSTASTSRLLITKKARAAAAKAGSDTRAGPGGAPGAPGSPPASPYTTPAAPRAMASWAELNRTLRAALPPSRSARAEQAPRATTPAGVPQPSTRAKANGWDMVVESRVPGRPSSSGISSAARTRAASSSTGPGSWPAARAAPGATTTSSAKPAVVTVAV